MRIRSPKDFWAGLFFIAVALGFINPLASILAFVDPGLANDQNCMALTSQAAQGKAAVKTPSQAAHKAAARHRH